MRVFGCSYLDTPREVLEGFIKEFEIASNEGLGHFGPEDACLLVEDDQVRMALRHGGKFFFVEVRETTAEEVIACQIAFDFDIAVREDAERERQEVLRRAREEHGRALKSTFTKSESDKASRGLFDSDWSKDWKKE